jgi:chemotaxis signal transduction protein
MNLRGTLLPVFDLHQLLGTGEGSRDQRTVLILDQRDDAVGIPIDGLPQSVALDRTLQNIPPLPEGLEAHVPAAYATGKALWLDFDHQSFFMAIGPQMVR